MSFLFPITIGLHQGLTLNSYLVTPVMYEITKLIQEEVPWCIFFVFVFVCLFVFFLFFCFFFLVLMDKI